MLDGVLLVVDIDEHDEHGERYGPEYEPGNTSDCGTDKSADVLWVGNSWGASLARIDTRTHEVSYVPLPKRMQPYHVHVDSKHRAWTNLWGADRVMRYDPQTRTWMAFDLPTRGAEPRYVSVHEASGEPTKVVLPYFRARKIAVITLRD